MFFSRSRPLVVREEQLRSLRLALNTPELTADELPAGPARAAIVAHEEPDGSVALSVLVSSLGNGALVCWSWDGATESGTLETAIDAALSFAEGMGFLFDDDALSSTSPEARRRALDHWWELTGWPVPDAASAKPSIEAGAGRRVQAAALAPATRDAPEPLPLTKFRRRLAPLPPEPPVPELKPEASMLGRLRLIKRARTGEAGERPPLWLRLLGSF